MTKEEKDAIKRQEEIEQILFRFVGDSDLHESCQSLLDCLKIKYTEIAPATLPPDAFFDPNFVEKNSQLLGKLDSVSVVGIASQDTFLTEERLTISREEMEQQLENDRYKEMAFFSIDANSSLTRTEIALVTRAFNRRMHFRPVVLFIRNGNLLSMSTCERSEYIQHGHEGEKVGKVTILRNIDCSHPHHGHVVILSSLDISSCKSSFDAVYEHWLATFSNELLTKKFYQELSDWFFWAIKNVRYPNNLDDPNDDEKYNHENVIRLVTRLIFVWFLKEKHLIPEEFFDEEYIRENLIQDFNPNEIVDLFYKSTESKYYKAILQNLFFATLNCPIIDPDSGDTNNRHFGTGNDDSNNKVMKYKKYFINPDLFVEIVNKKVPFLNGGLFDCLDDSPKHLYYDGFSDKEDISKSLVVPDYLFFGDKMGKDIDLSEEYGDKKKKKVSTRGIIDILKRYNFTIEENTPFDQEVSLDPELLGKVFENLLASYNPETKTTARKQTGSFYTPRDIVQYMVDESIVEHLKRTVGEENESLYRDLISYSSGETELSEEMKSSIMKSIYNCKVLDPACGSGAFPVGMLQQMVHILSKIDPENKKWEDLIIDAATDASREAFQTESQADREEKLADITASFNEKLNYPDYARKLYIIENCIYGVDIQPIAIQISHLRFFISLIVDQKENSDPKANFGIRPLPNLEAKFVAANSLIPLDKGATLFTTTPEYIQMEKGLHEANHHIFTAKSPQKKAAWKKILRERRNEMATTLVEKGFVDENAGNQIASWDMFDQNSHAGFFDAEWMFGIKDGFDIVIGNPPYVAVRSGSIPDADKVVYKKVYKSANGQFDLYALFIERGLFSLCKDGILTMITESTFVNNKDFEPLRKIIIHDNTLHAISYLGETVFNTAQVDVCISVIKHNNYPEGHNILVCTSDKDFIARRFNELTQSVFDDSTSKYEIKIKTNSDSSRIFEKMKKSGITLKDVVNLPRGAEFGSNSNLFSTTYKNGYYKWIVGKDIKRYSISFNNRYAPFDNNDVSVYKEFSFYAGQKLLIQRIRNLTLKDRIVATFDGSGYICTNTLRMAIMNDSELAVKYDIKVILAILNSSLVNYIFRTLFLNKDIYKYQLEQIPLPSVNQADSKIICNIVDSLLAENESSEPNSNKINELAAEIDRLIYKIYGIDSSDISIIEQS